SHLVLDLARLCRDSQKQKELIETYNASLQGNGLQVNGEAQGRGWFKYNNASKKWKGKSLNTTGCNSKDKVADCIINQCMQIAVKLLRVRLGYGSMAALLDPKDSEPNPEPEALDNKLDSSQNSSGALPVRGVWKKGGSKKLFS
ncbi:uncharacterized protein LOC120141278, partial [Hibiscus syriacus]|uniref:uncharacterized protein LOC120141278 n=1 Tax=Hibiscus syriacus TaxID=106335 RepID=UPI0019225F6B